MSTFTNLFNKVNPPHYYFWNNTHSTPNYFVLGGVRLGVKNIQTDYQVGTVDKPYIGGYGSYLGWTGEGAKILTIPCIVGSNGIKQIIRLKNTRRPIPLVSPSPARYNGYYIVTGVKHNETKRGRFDAEITITEYVPPKVTGNLVTTQDLSNMAMTNMLRVGSPQALSKLQYPIGSSCREYLKVLKGKKRQVTDDDYRLLFKKSPRCQKYLVGEQCYYLLRKICKGNTALFEKLYPKCKGYMNLRDVW